MYGGNAIWNKYVFSFFRKIAIVSNVLESDGESIPDPRHSDRESPFVQIKFCFRHNKLQETSQVDSVLAVDIDM